jgi:hypothetical protein
MNYISPEELLVYETFAQKSKLAIVWILHQLRVLIISLFDHLLIEHALVLLLVLFFDFVVRPLGLFKLFLITLDQPYVMFFLNLCLLVHLQTSVINLQYLSYLNVPLFHFPLKNRLVLFATLLLI